MTTTTTEVSAMFAEGYDALITEDIDFRVETRKIQTVGDHIMGLPNHEATIRINQDGSEIPLWVVGSRYEVVDHKDVIKGFAEALDKADLEAEVEHKVYANGSRIYSFFTMDKEYEFDEKKKARPFFVLQTSHDGSLKLGFMIGARVGKKTLNISKTVYGAHAKHTKGINIEKTLKEISRALNSFVTEVVPMWERMSKQKISVSRAQKIIDQAVKKNIVSKRRADEVNAYDCNTVWDTYTNLVDATSTITTKRGTEERAFDRNTKVGEFFQKLAGDKDMSGLKKLAEKE